MQLAHMSCELRRADEGERLITSDPENGIDPSEIDPVKTLLEVGDDIRRDRLAAVSIKLTTLGARSTGMVKTNVSPSDPPVSTSLP
jgi:hypothetical protein